MTTEKGKSETQLGKQPEEMGAEKEGEAAISQGLPKTAGKATQRMILPRAFRGEFAFEGTLTLDFKMCIRCTLQVLHMPFPRDRRLVALLMMVLTLQNRSCESCG